jgi:hypothetical protein
MRPFLYGFYRYVLAGGFLDGRQAFTYHFMHALWYRLLIDMKYLELKKERQRLRAISPAQIPDGVPVAHGEPAILEAAKPARDGGR